MTILAATVYLLGLLLVTAGTGWWHRRSTGTSPFTAAPPSRPARWAAGLAGAAAALSLAAPVLAAGAALPPATGALRIGGLVLMCAGIVAVLVAQADMGTSWRSGVDPAARTELVTRGLFSVVRHPVLASLVAVQCGHLLALPSWATLVALACLLAAVHVQARLVEEPHLLAVHGEAYRWYARGTGRFLPWTGRALPPPPRAPGVPLPRWQRAGGR